MKKNKNIPLNLKEQINSRIGLICSEAGRSGCQRSRAEET